MSRIDLTVPDLGGFKDVPVIDVLVAPGDSVEVDANELHALRRFR